MVFEDLLGISSRHAPGPRRHTAGVETLPEIDGDDEGASTFIITINFRFFSSFPRREGGPGESGRPTSPLVDYFVNLQLQPAKEEYARLKRPRSRRLARARLPTGITRGKCHDRQRLGICRYNRSYRAASSPQLGWPM